MSLLTIPLLLLTLQAPDSGNLRSRVEARIAQAPARAVGLYYRDLTTGSGDSITVGSALRFHAASTMKVPVMIQLFRDRDVGLLMLVESISVMNLFLVYHTITSLQVD